MKIRTQEELFDYLSDEIAWRKKELIDYKLIVENYKTGLLVKPLLRGGITILYAHWEGFIKQASIAYLNYVAMKKLSYEQIAMNFVALSIKNKIGKTKESISVEVCNEVVDILMNKKSQTCDFPFKEIDTEFNLKSKVLKNIVLSLGLDFSHYLPLENFIDKSLLAARNEVAHGDYKNLNYDDYVVLHNKVLSLLEYFKTQIENAVVKKEYKNAF